MKIRIASCTNWIAVGRCGWLRRAQALNKSSSFIWFLILGNLYSIRTRAAERSSRTLALAGDLLAFLKIYANVMRKIITCI